MPKFEDTLQFPHVLFWTPDGLIKRILMRRRAPDPSFWLSPDQLTQAPGILMEAWAGEGAAEEIFESESETDSEEEQETDEESSSSEEEEVEEEPIDKYDVREKDGAAISAILFLKEKQSQADEYIPGGELVISLQSIITPISEAFICVQQKSSQYESFDAVSGQRVGSFSVHTPLPWEMDQAVVDPLGYKPPRRHHVPEGVCEQARGEAIRYRETLRYDDDEEGGEAQALPGPPYLQIVWQCPGPELGNAMLCFALLCYDMI